MVLGGVLGIFKANSVKTFDGVIAFQRALIVFAVVGFISPLVQAKSSPQSNGTALREKRLLEAKALKAEKALGKAKKPVMTAGKIGLSLPVGIGASYLINPDDFTPEKSIKEVLFALSFRYPVLFGFMPKSTAECDTVGCQQFAKQCAKKMNYSDAASVNEIFAGKASAQCILDFFEQPLEEQARQREDANLDRMLSAFSLGVRDVTCAGGSANVEVYRNDPQSFQYDFYFKKMSDWKLEKVKVPGRETFRYNIQFSSNGKPNRVMATDENGSMNNLHFNKKGEPTLLQHCDQNMNCPSYEMDELKSKKLYSWSQENRLPSGKMPAEAFRWAREALPLVDFQNKKEQKEGEEPVWKGNRIQDCCKSSKCQNFFSQRAKAFHKAKEAVRSSKGTQ